MSRNFKLLDERNKATFENWEEGERRDMIRGPGKYSYVKVDGSEEGKYDIRAIDTWGCMGPNKISGEMLFCYWIFDDFKVGFNNSRGIICRDETIYEQVRTRFQEVEAESLFNYGVKIDLELFERCEGLLQQQTELLEWEKIMFGKNY